MLAEKLAAASKLPAWYLELEPEGDGLPPELTVLAVAKSLGTLPDIVRDMWEDDVLDQLQWMQIDGLVARMREVESSRTF